MPRSLSAWKQAERKWARFFGRGARRHSSQGIRYEDISGNWFVAEHKFRQFEDYSAEFRKAIEQHDDNKVRNPTKESLILFTFHSGRGTPNRYFLMLEVVGQDWNGDFMGMWNRINEKAIQEGDDS